MMRFAAYPLLAAILTCEFCQAPYIREKSVSASSVKSVSLNVRGLEPTTSNSKELRLSNRRLNQ
jgi:hypothetical protein